MTNQFRREGSDRIRESRGRRPLGIAAIGIYMLFGACLMPINIWLHAPAFFMGAALNGWKAIVFFVAMGALDAVIGVGVLRAAARSRVAAIYFFVFRAANTLVTFLLPGSRGRFEEGVEAMRAALGQQVTRRSPVWFGAVVELCVMAFILWFLFTHREAFLPPNEGPRASSLAAERDI